MQGYKHICPRVENDAHQQHFAAVTHESINAVLQLLLHVFAFLANNSVCWKITLLHYISSKKTNKFLALTVCALRGLLELSSISSGTHFNLY